MNEREQHETVKPFTGGGVSELLLRAHELVRQSDILHGAIVGAPAMPEDFE